MARVLKPTPVAQDRSGGNRTLGLKSMAQVLSPLWWHKSTLAVASKPTPVAQADSGRNLKPVPAAKLFVFYDFLFALAFRKVLFVFCILSPPRVAQSRLLKSHLKVRSERHKVDFGSQVASQSPLRAAS
jgi:hypothetical protein